MLEYDVTAKSYLSQNLRVIMSVWKLDQHEFSKLIGLNYATFNNYMNEGAFPRVPTLLIIGDVTGVSLDILLRGEIPIHMIPERPIKDTEVNQHTNLVREDTPVYRSENPPLVDVSGLEKEIRIIKNEIAILRASLPDIAKFESL